MLRNGWVPIPCQAKEKMLTGWTKVAVTEQQIQDWDSYRKDADDKPLGSSLKGTGLRLEGDIFVVDLDIQDANLMNEVLDAIEAAYPEWLYGVLWRNSGAVSWALFSRVSGLPDPRPRSWRTFGRIAEDGTVSDKAHCEIHGSWSRGRYFAAFGPHKTPGREYAWHGASPENTRLDSLPVFPVDQIGKLIDLIEEVLGRHLQIISNEKLETGKSLYDLTPETQFRLKGGETVTASDLENMLDIGIDGVRGVLAEDWDKSEGKDRHHAFRRERNGRLVITDHTFGINHYWVDEEAVPSFELDDETRAVLAGMLDNVGADGGAEAASDIPDDRIITDTDPKKTHDNAVNWLARNVAWFTGAFNGRGGVTSIHPAGEFIKPVTLPSLRQRMMSYCWVEIGPRGGVHVHNPVDAWSMLSETDKVCIGGMRMRPELPRPIFSDDGLLFVNRYSPPQHPAGGGTIAPFEARMMRLIPDAAERRWVWNWLATKVQHPEWRMVGLAMVGREHGTGRGLFAETLQLVLGEVFVVPLPYDAVTGNSRFNAEVEGKLLIYVNEARHGDSHKFGPKNAAREALKVFIEPNHRLPFRVEPKGVDAYFTRAAISTMIFANSIKAVPIDDEDRRTAVVINGSQMSVSERDSYQAWMLVPENIGALYRHLRALAVTTDTTEFDPYLAPAFIGRDQMIDANKTSLDRAWALAVEKLRAASDLYAMCQVVDLVVQITKSSYPDYRDLVQTHTYEHGYRIGRKRPVEQNWRIRYGTGEDNRQAIFAFDDVAAKRWTNAEPHQIKAQLLKAQKAVDAPGRAFNKLLSLVPKDGEPE